MNDDFCTKEEQTSCRAKTIPTCLPKEDPVRNKDCCMSCAPPQTLVCGQDSDSAGLGRPTGCTEADFSALPECSAGIKPYFSIS